MTAEAETAAGRRAWGAGRGERQAGFSHTRFGGTCCTGRAGLWHGPLPTMAREALGGHPGLEGTPRSRAAVEAGVLQAGDSWKPETPGRAPSHWAGEGAVPRPQGPAGDPEVEPLKQEPGLLAPQRPPGGAHAPIQVQGGPNPPDPSSLCSLFNWLL